MNRNTVKMYKHKKECEHEYDIGNDKCLNCGQECEHNYDGGECLYCCCLSLCELCDEKPWEIRCDICEGGRICEDCYIICEKCDNKICRVCTDGFKYKICEDCLNE